MRRMDGVGVARGLACELHHSRKGESLAARGEILSGERFDQSGNDASEGQNFFLSAGLVGLCRLGLLLETKNVDEHEFLFWAIRCPVRINDCARVRRCPREFAVEKPTGQQTTTRPVIQLAKTPMKGKGGDNTNARN